MNWPEPRAFLGIIRGVIMGSDDSKKMQTIDFRSFHNELLTAERPQIYGITSVVPAPDDNGAKGAEITVGFVNGNRSHAIVLSDGDPRTRPKNLKPGESKHHDDQGQYSHLSRDGHVAVAKNHSITAGDEPDTGGHEVNDQLKGIEARLSHMEHSHAGMFDVTSRLNTIAMTKIPQLAELTPILNQAPNGLTMMTEAIEGKFPAYLQQHIQDAVAKFLSPTITGVGSVMGGADGIIAALEARVADLISSNPIIATVDSLVDELSALQGSGSPAVVASMAPVIQGLIDSATAGNPIIGQVADLRSQLASLTAAAGPALRFLGPQQRIPQRLSKSLKLAP